VWELHSALERGVDAKNRVVPSNRFECRYRVLVRDWEVLTATSGNLAPCLEDGGSLVRRNLSQQNRIRLATLNQRHPTRRP
jgi:hypothetical protein